MGSFDQDSATVRGIRGTEVLRLVTEFQTLAGYLGERRDRMMEALQEIRDNTAGDFQPGDLGAMRALIATERTRFQVFGASFDPGLS